MFKELLSHSPAIDAANNPGLTALLTAASWGHAGCVAVLLAAGADPNFADIEGKVALDHAHKGGFTDCVSLLEGWKVKVEAQTTPEYKEINMIDFWK